MLHFLIALGAGLLGLSALAVATLLWVTRVPPPVPATVIDDASRPRLEGDGVLLPGSVAGAPEAPSSSFCKT